jgi:hypothetical protein
LEERVGVEKGLGERVGVVRGLEERVGVVRGLEGGWVWEGIKDTMRMNYSCCHGKNARIAIVSTSTCTLELFVILPPNLSLLFHTASVSCNDVRTQSCTCTGPLNTDPDLCLFVLNPNSFVINLMIETTKLNCYYRNTGVAY